MHSTLKIIGAFLSMSSFRYLLFLLIALLQGCADIAYVGQAVNGHLWVMQERRALEVVIADPKVSAAEREMLKKAARIRVFASDVLGLPENDSYRRYSDLGRDYVVINVVAAPALSLQPMRWCYPITGCLPYRGYYSLQRARQLSNELQGEGWETYLAKVPAYSTLGWFDDPLLNTMLSWGEADLAGLVFHELVHQKLYVPNDTVFNESLAVAVENEGVRRWLQQEGKQDLLRAWQRDRQQVAKVRGVLRALRSELATLYAGDLSDADKRVFKVHLLDKARARYRLMGEKNHWGKRFDSWFYANLNNAFLVLMNTYHQYVPAFETLLASVNGDLPRFYKRVEALAAMPKQERMAVLAGL